MSGISVTIETSAAPWNATCSEASRIGLRARRSGGHRGLRARRWVPSSPTRPVAAAARHSASQPRVSTASPPGTGPRIEAMTLIIAIIPCARPRWRGATETIVWFEMARNTGMPISGSNANGERYSAVVVTRGSGPETEKAPPLLMVPFLDR